MSRVMVVEEEHKVASALKEGLEGEGYDVVVEHSGEAALVRLKTDACDIILLDLLLPGRGGLEVLSTPGSTCTSQTGPQSKGSPT